MFVTTVHTDIPPAIQVNKEETFTPVITITPYYTFHKALRIANACEYGIQVGIFTQSINLAMRAFGGMQVGGVQVNDIPTFRSDAMPYGGDKGSGLGARARRAAVCDRRDARDAADGDHRAGGME